MPTKATGDAPQLGDPQIEVFVPAALLRHVRTIHFSQLATAFVLLVAAFLQPPADLDRALKELYHVSRIRAASAEAASTAFFNHADRCKSTTGGISTINIGNELINWHYQIGSKAYGLHPDTWGNSASPYWISVSSDPMGGLLRFPGTGFAGLERQELRDFEQSWNSLLGRTSAFAVTRLHPESASYRWLNGDAPPPFPAVDSSVGPQTTKSGQLTEAERIPVRFGLRSLDEQKLMYGAVEAGKSSANLEIALYAENPTVEFPNWAQMNVDYILLATIPVDVVRVSCRPLEDLLKLAKFSDNETIELNHTFERAFGDLYKLSSGLESLTIDDLQGYIQRLRDDNGKEIELYGAKIPKQAISIWGAILLNTIALYFVAHLARVVSFRVRKAKLPDVAWIGIYPDRLSRTIVLGSVVLPPATIVTLIAKTWGPAPNLSLTILQCIAALLSLILSYFAWLQIQSISRFDVDLFSGSKGDDGSD